MRKELMIGLGIYSITLLLKQFIELPEMLSGLLLGLAICFEFIGILSNDAYSKLKEKKKVLFHIG